MATMKGSTKIQRREKPLWLFAGVGLAGGAIGMALVAASSDSLTFDWMGSGLQPASADVNTSLMETGDPRVTWRDLPTGSISPLVSDGNRVWFSVMAEIDPERGPVSDVYEYSLGTLRRIAAFDGNAHAATRLDSGELLFGGDRRIHLVTAGGDVTSSSIEPPNELVPGEGNFITALAALGDSAYVSFSNSSEVTVVELPSLAAASTLAIGDTQAPPSVLEATTDRRLLMATPFGHGSRAPHATLVDVDTGRLEVLPGPVPHGFARSAGTLWGLPPGPDSSLVRLSGRGYESFDSTSAIPWTGKFDQVAVSADGILWAAPTGAGQLYRQSPDGVLETLALPVYRRLPSLPAWLGSEAAASVDRSQTRTVESMVVLTDGTLVIRSSSPTGALGIIRP